MNVTILYSFSFNFVSVSHVICDILSLGGGGIFLQVELTVRRRNCREIKHIERVEVSVQVLKKKKE